MKDWTPKRVTFDPSLTLSRNESFVLSRVDGTLSVSDLVDITGLGSAEIEVILHALVRQGAVSSDPGESAPTIDPSPDELDGIPEERVSWIADQLPGMEAASSEPDLAAYAMPELHDARLELEEVSPAEPEASDAATDRSGEDAPEEDGARAEEAGTEQTYRALYEAAFRMLSVTERSALARMTSGEQLMALCFDPDPKVIRAIIENEHVNATHARLIAFHHRNPVGLEHVVARVEFLRDTQVQRRLLRNTQLTESLLKRLLMPKRLIEVYKTSNDRDVPERTRAGAKGLFKTKYGQSAPEEKFELIWNTEGRVLTALLGQTIDQKTAAMMCGRTFTSVMLIQSLARFPATPPLVLAHLLKQPLVKRQLHLRNMLLRHPNVPSDAKRKL